MTRTADVVIAGAGIAGIAAAWQIAARLGSTSTVLVDPRPPLSLTSDRPGANYRDWWPQAAMVALADRSIAMAEGLLADGASFAMDRRGYLFVTADPEVADGLQRVVAERVAIGVEAASVDVLDRAQLDARFRASRAGAARGHPRTAGGQPRHGRARPGDAGSHDGRWGDRHDGARSWRSGWPAAGSPLSPSPRPTASRRSARSGSSTRPGRSHARLPRDSGRTSSSKPSSARRSSSGTGWASCRPMHLSPSGSMPPAAGRRASTSSRIRAGTRVRSSSAGRGTRRRVSRSPIRSARLGSHARWSPGRPRSCRACRRTSRGRSI